MDQDFDLQQTYHLHHMQTFMFKVLTETFISKKISEIHLKLIENWLKDDKIIHIVYDGNNFIDFNFDN